MGDSDLDAIRAQRMAQMQAQFVSFLKEIKQKLSNKSTTGQFKVFFWESNVSVCAVVVLRDTCLEICLKGRGYLKIILLYMVKIKDENRKYLKNV